MTNEQKLDIARAKEAWSRSKGGVPSRMEETDWLLQPSTVAARLARENWQPPCEDSEPDQAEAIREVMIRVLSVPADGYAASQIRAGKWDHLTSYQCIAAGIEYAKEQSK